jgi:probable F420-dependent oxidoreductase
LRTLIHEGSADTQGEHPVMSQPARPFRFGLVNELLGGDRPWVEHVRRIDEASIDVLLVRDHVAVEPFGPQLAPFAMLATAAAVTRKLRLGTMVLDNDYRHPGLVAHEVATVDVLSDGRFELGLGAGWLRREYECLGLTFDVPSVRIARLVEALSIIAPLLEGESVSFRGDHYSIDAFQLPIGPVQQPRPPILIGAGGPRMLGLAGRNADIVGILPAPIRRDDDDDDPRDRMPAAMDAKLALLREAAGDRFDALELSVFSTFIVTDARRRETDELVQRMGWTGLDYQTVWTMPSVFIGSLGQIREDLEFRRERFGLSYFVTSDRAFDHIAAVAGNLAGR